MLRQRVLNNVITSLNVRENYRSFWNLSAGADGRRRLLRLRGGQRQEEPEHRGDLHEAVRAGQPAAGNVPEI